MALGVNTVSIAVRSALPSVGALLIIGNETLAFREARHVLTRRSMHRLLLQRSDLFTARSLSQHCLYK